MIAQTSAIIMASGFSKRMSTNKLFLKYHNQTFLERAIGVALAAGFDEVIVVIKPEDLDELDFPSKVQVVLNKNSKLGQSSSVRLGTAKAKSTNHLIYLVVDQPLLSVLCLRKIVSIGQKDKIVVPMVNGEPTSPVFFGADFRQELLNVSGQTGGREVRNRHREKWVSLAISNEVLTDIDTPENYSELLQKNSDF